MKPVLPQARARPGRRLARTGRARPDHGPTTSRSRSTTSSPGPRRVRPARFRPGRRPAVPHPGRGACPDGPPEVPGSAWAAASTKRCCPAPGPGSAAATARPCPGRRPRTRAADDARPASASAREEAGEADVVAGGQADPDPPTSITTGSPRAPRCRTRGSRRRRRGGSCRSRVHPGAGGQQRVATRPSGAGVNIPATTTSPCSAAISRTPVGPRPVQRLGDRGQRQAEAAHRRLREDHEPRAGLGGPAGLLAPPGPRLARGRPRARICAMRHPQHRSRRTLRLARLFVGCLPLDVGAADPEHEQDRVQIGHRDRGVGLGPRPPAWR